MTTPFVEFVELFCEKTVGWFVVPLAYNILLMTVCAAIGFLTRSLPENFNESAFIFISVATTLFAWVVFIPAYFNAYYAYLQSAILAFCLLLNTFVTIGCQFLRIVYAVFFIPPESIHFSTVATAANKINVGTTAAAANAAPPSIGTSLSVDPLQVSIGRG